MALRIKDKSVAFTCSGQTIPGTSPRAYFVTYEIEDAGNAKLSYRSQLTWHSSDGTQSESAMVEAMHAAIVALEGLS